MTKNAVELVKNQKSLAFFNQPIFGPKTKQLVETHLRPQESKPIPQGGEIQNGDTGNNKDLAPDWGVGNVNRFQRHILPYTH